MLNMELNFENIDEQEWTERLPILVLPTYSPNVEFERVHFWSLLYFPKINFKLLDNNLNEVVPKKPQYSRKIAMYTFLVAVVFICAGYY